MADNVAFSEVMLWGHRVGAVAETADGQVVFEYDRRFADLGLQISPLRLPLSLRGPISFPELRKLDAFDGLPGVLADALPDRFGNAIIKKYFTNIGKPNDALSPVQKLLYIGSRAMGALEFRPPLREKLTPIERDSIELASLVQAARKIVEGKVNIAVPEIMQLGSSAGGQRPKAVILYNRKNKEVRSAFTNMQPGDEHWVIKFDGVGELDHPNPKPQPYNRTEYVYWLMAKAAGIDVPEVMLLEERRLAHLMSKRFDRVGDKRLHQHSLGGMEHVDYNLSGAYSYEQFMRVVMSLNLGQQAVEQAYRRTVFNIMARNQDDHVKNISFLMDNQGRWRLAPAYDLTYAKGAGFTSTHQMTLRGKNEGLKKQDLLDFGAQFDVKKNGKHIIEEVRHALGRWPALAKKWHVPDGRIMTIREGMRLMKDE
ncbi:MAG: type II toxin-antitoxin system HipA family toxin [Burkholderiales bacterium]